MKHKALPGNLHRIRFSLTMTSDETEADSIGWAVGEMLDSLPAAYQARTVVTSFERDRRGREGSNRVFLTLIGEKRPSSSGKMLARTKASD